MSIFAAIHARWEDSAALIALCPADQFTTGERQDGDVHPPAAFLTRQSESKGWTNSQPSITTSLRLQLFVRKHIDGENIKAEVEEQFDNADWVTGLTTVTKCRITNVFEIQDPDDPTIWQFNFDLETDHFAE
jgi:hypothetical protein